MAEAPEDERARVGGLIMASWTTQAIGVAARLKLFDALSYGPRAAVDLAAETGSHAGALYRLLRALAVLGLVRQLDQDRFELAAGGRLLCEGQPNGLRGVALHWGERLWGALSQLDHSVATGEPWRASGLEGFEMMARDPAQMAMFHQSMADQTGPVARTMLEAYDFSRFRSLIDVGGSTGALLVALLKANPGLTGKIYDLPALGPTAESYLEAQGLAERASFIGGSFFDEVPAGADAYSLKMIIHDWDDEKSLAILGNCRKAMAPGAVVLVMEKIAPELAGPADYATIRGDMLMLTAAGGRERTRGEYEALFSQAGLALTGITSTASGFSVLEAAPA
jgi:hypothetical protein